MPYFYVEGKYLTKIGRRRSMKSGRVALSDIEPFARSFWANSPREALQLANEVLDGGEWIEPPRVSQTSEEERMRQIGAPELPGFEAGKKRGRRR